MDLEALAIEEDDLEDEVVMTFSRHHGTPLREMEVGFLKWMVKTVDYGNASGPMLSFVKKHRELIESMFDPRSIAANVVVDYTLSHSQNEAVNAILDTLLLGDAPYMKLEGGAGYGKTFVCIDLVRRAMGEGYNVHACATSYVATQELAKQMDRYGIVPRTIAATLKMKPEINVDTGEETYEETDETYSALMDLLRPKHLLLVDEYSMVNDEVATQMMAIASEMGGKLLVVGDLHQLPPVKQATDSVFSTIPYFFTLTEPKRYAIDSDLFRLEQVARENPYAFSTLDWSGSEEITVHSTNGEMYRQFAEDYLGDPKLDSRMLFFRRADVIAANAILRDMIFGNEAALASPVIEDERLMVTSTVFVPTGQYMVNERTGRDEEIINRWYSGETFLVEDVAEATVDGVPCYNVKFHGRDSRANIVFGMTAAHTAADFRGSEEFSMCRKELRDVAIQCTDKAARKEAWKAFYRFTNQFVVVMHPYASTVHRSQGASLDRVYFNPAQLNGGYMTPKLLYVAATRAKKAMHFVE